MRWNRICVGAIALAWLGPAPLKGWEATPIPKDKLEPFLRSVPADQFSWCVTGGPDFEVYYGTANAPLSGSVGFYVGWAPRPLPADVPTFRSKLGQFPVRWHRTFSDDGLTHQEAIVSLGESRQVKAHIWVAAQDETQLNTLLAAVGKLPIFASGDLPSGLVVIDAAMAQEEHRHRMIWAIWSAVVFTTGWFVDRLLRCRKSSPARRLSAFSINVAVWIPITIGLIFMLGSIAMDEFSRAKGWLLFAAAALLSLIGFLLAAGLFLVARLRARRTKTVSATNA
jgi:hypothetical protein